MKNINIRTLLFVLLLGCAAWPSFGQIGLQWVDRDVSQPERPTMGSTGVTGTSQSEIVRGVTSDTSGHTYVVTTYETNQNTGARGAPPRQQIGIYKYDSLGAIVWKTKIETTGDNSSTSGRTCGFYSLICPGGCCYYIYTTGRPSDLSMNPAFDIAVDTSGIYVATNIPLTATAMNFYSAASPNTPAFTLGLSAASSSPTAVSEIKGGFVLAKFKLNGDFAWQTSTETSKKYSQLAVSDIEVDAQGNIYLSGDYPASTSIKARTTPSTGITIVPAEETQQTSPVFNSNSLTTGSPTWNRVSGQTVCNATAGTNYYYHALSFRVNQPGDYIFNVQGSGAATDTYAALYENSFNAANPCGTPSDFIIADDDGNVGPWGLGSRIAATLTPGVTYILITTTFSVGAQMNFSWTYSGPNNSILTDPVTSSAIVALPAVAPGWATSRNVVAGYNDNNTQYYGSSSYAGRQPYVASYSRNGNFRWLTGADLTTTTYKYCNYYCSNPNTNATDLVLASEPCPSYPCSGSSSISNYRSVPFSNAKVRALSIDANSLYWSGEYEDGIRRFFTMYSSGAIQESYPTPTIGSNIANVLPQGTRDKDGFLIKTGTSNPENINFIKTFQNLGEQSVKDVLVNDGDIYYALELASSKYAKNAGMPYDTGYLSFVAGPLAARTSEVYIGQLENGGANAVLWQQSIEPTGVLSDNSAVEIKGGDVLSLDRTNEKYLYAGGTFYGRANILEYGANASFPNPPVRTSAMTSVALADRTMDVWFAKFDKINGQTEWLKSIGGSGNDDLYGIHAVKDRVYLGGAFVSIMDFEPSATLQRNQSSLGRLDGYVAKYGCNTMKVYLDSSSYPLCEGNTIKVVASVNCTAESECRHNYQWIDQQNNSITTLDSVLTLVNLSGSQTRKVIVTDLNTGCQMVDSISFIISPAISLSIFPATALICDGNSTIFSTSSPDNNLAYRWFLDGSVIPLVNGPTYNAFNQGAYRVEATQAGTGCKAASVASLNKYQSLYPYVAPDTGLLCGNRTVLEVLNCPGCSFSWTVPFSSNASSTIATIEADIQGTYVVNMIDNNGCAYQVPATVQVGASLTPSIFAKDGQNNTKTTLCDGAPLVVQTTPCTGCTYRWSDGSTANYTFAFNPGTFAVTVTNTINGCSGRSVDLVVTAASMTTPMITATPGSICSVGGANDPAILAVANPLANHIYTWYNNNNMASAIATGSSVTVTSAGDYVLLARDTVKKCEVYSSVRTVSNRAASKPLIQSTSRFYCGGAYPTVSTTSCVGCSYQWYRRVGNWLPIAGANNPLYTLSDTGSYIVEVSYANGCAVKSDSMDIVASALTATIANTNVPYICNGDSVVMYATGSITASPFWQYQWYRNSSVLAGATGDMLITYQPGTYSLEITDNNGCKDMSNTIAISNSNRTANPALVGSPTSLCAGDTAVLTVSVPNCPLCHFEFRNGTGNSLRPMQPNPTYNLPASQVDRLFFVEVLDTATGCRSRSNFVQIQDTFLPTPTLVALSNPVCSPNGVILSTNPQANTTYIWQSSSGASYVSAQNTFRVDSVEGNYSVKIRQGNCESQSSNQIPVTFANFNAQLNTSGSTTICNGSNVRFSVSPINPVVGGITSNNLLALTTQGTNANLTLSVPSVSPGYANANQIIGVYIDSIFHDNLANLQIQLIPPTGAAIDLYNSSSTGTGTIKRVTFTDAAAQSIGVVTSGSVAPGSYRPAQPLSSLTGTANGTWQLVVITPGAGTDTGYVSNWRLIYNYNRYNYRWLNNNNLIPNTSRDTVYFAAAAGNYRVEVVDSLTGCISSTLTVPVQDVAVGGVIASSTTILNLDTLNVDTSYICGNLGTTQMSVPACAGCSYRWYRNGLLIGGANAANYSVTGVAAVATYTAEISNGGCSVRDSIRLISTPDFTTTISVAPSHANICGGSPVTLSSNPIGVARQWFLGGTAISGIVAQQPSYQTSVAGAYNVVAVNDKGCSATSNSITTIASNPPAGFALVLDAVNPLPNSAPDVQLNDYLNPVAIRGGTGVYSSATASGAINNTTDVFNPRTAGAGLHIITYTHRVDSCYFTVSDTVEVLEAARVDVVNRRLQALGSSTPLYEACLQDSLRFTISNFPFVPSSVEFLTNTGSISVPVASVVTPNGSVFSGYVPVIVPNNAITGKVKLINGTDTFQTPFFMVVQNPAVSMNLVGVSQPVCSNQPSIALTAVPATGATGRGRFAGAYLSNPNDTVLTPATRLVAQGGDSLLIRNVGGYDVLSGVQNLRLYYVFTPYYTGTTLTCPSITTSLDVEARNVRLDSIQYTPIAITQTAESMFNLTRMVFPISSRVFAGSYSGTYINSSNILPATISAGWGPQPVTYTINNGACSNSITDTIDVMRRPILDSIPSYICRRPNDTVFIGRDAISMYIGRRIAGAVTPVSRFNNLYTYQFNTSAVSITDYSLTEQVNIMTLTSSNGGLTTINATPGQELYALVPSNISATSTSLSLSFGYDKLITYFDPAAVIIPATTASYMIGQTSRVVNFEDLQPVTINPAIVANPVFCKENQIYQFSGSPNGGQYYLDTSATVRLTLANNLFNPNDYNTPSGINTFRLTYIYTGPACRDSANINIRIPRPFQITLTSPSAPNFCQEEPNDTIQIVSNIGSFPAPTNALDMSSGVFYVGGVQSGQIFSPSLRGPGIYPVQYTVADSFGCTATDTSTFRVDSTPNIAITPTLPSFLCANSPVVNLSIFANGVDITPTAARAPNTVSITGTGVVNAATNNPIYHPLRAAGFRRDLTVRDTIVYTLVGPNGCRNSISQTLTIRELPALALTVLGGAPVEASYCEGDSVRIVGLPLGGSFTDRTNTNGFYGFNAANGQFNPILRSNLSDTLQTFLYTYYDINTQCNDTIFGSTLIKNRAEVFITGISPVVCASDTTISLGLTPRPASPAVAVTSGSFTANRAAALRELSTNPSIAGMAEVYPDSAGVYDDSLRLRIRLNFSSNGCPSYTDTSFRINPLPQLSFNPPGDTLLSTANDSRFHICETADSVFMVARNRFRGLVSPIVPDTVRTGGFGFVGRGIRFFPSANGFVYYPDSAGYGVDTITYRYRDIRGCVNSAVGYTVIDTVPALGFAGFVPSKQTNQLIATEDSFAYCANDPGATIVPSPFGGFLYFQNALQSNGIYDFIPDNLDTTPARTYTLTYRYIAQRYANGGVCQDSIKTYVTVKPTPVLNFIALPTQVCINDSTDKIPLQANPVGGSFQDFSNPIATGGIVADTLFDPVIQQGNRVVAYIYTDPQTSCSDTITQTIAVYRIPEVVFSTGGGCQGDQILFETSPTRLSATAPARDSITMYAWEFGDGLVDTVRPTTAAGRISVPNKTHNYAAGGAYFPMLTVVNQGVCVDSLRIRVAVSPKVTVTEASPYVQDFEAMAEDWLQETTVSPYDSLWDWGIAAGSRITTDQVQNHVWVTHLEDPYEAGERGWVYSPCFDISDLTRPMMALDVWADTRAGVDGATVEYYHPTRGWVVLGERDKGRNWYDSLYLISAPGAQIDSAQYAPLGWSGENLDGFKRAAYRLDTDRRNGDLRGMRSARFRVAFAASDNTVPNGREGFAFDNVYVGNRTTSVLVEHFSNQNIAGISPLETNLYSNLFNNLYGRDVVFMQYQTDLGGADLYYNQAPSESNARTLYYGVSTVAKKVRINGQDFVDLTEDLVRNMNNEREYLDMEMLKEDTFQISIPVVPQVFQAATNSPTGQANVTVTVTSTKNIPLDKYIVHSVITEDSLINVVAQPRYRMMGVVRTMQPNAAGLEFEQPFAAGESVDIPINWTFPTATYKKSNLKLVVFVQNQASKQVYQVATSRDLTVFEGPVNVDELADRDGKEIIDVKVYPNPATAQFTVAFDQELEGEYDWRVVDALGQVVKQGRAQAGTQQFDINTDDFAAGMYIFSINNQLVYTQRQVIVIRP